tara:strand:+ start:1327 stop:2553 length:1227 start_codon:yes stop_codon:yes gene_type:complete
MFFIRSFFKVATLIGLFLFLNCSGNENNDKTAQEASKTAALENGASSNVDRLKSEILRSYAELVYVSYQDARTETLTLKTELEAFLATPSEAGLASCKQAWIAARKPYGQTEAYRFSSGPIDDMNGPEGFLNGWPLDESYVDYTQQSATTGIINNPSAYPSIDAELLKGLNERGGEENISLGYHAIEFLLWGQDSEAPSAMTSGKRPYTDYLAEKGTAMNQLRRGKYLQITSKLLVEHLQVLIDAWAPNVEGNYRSHFLSMDSDKALKQVISGIGRLSKSELAGERMFVALANQDQEDEQSCFSDNTQRDILHNAQGIRNVYTGSYTRVDGSEFSGPSIHELVQRLDPNLASELIQLSLKTVELCQEIPAPFDYQLISEQVGGKGPLMNAIVLLQKQGDKLSQATMLL